MNRRHFLSAVAASSATALSGCSARVIEYGADAIDSPNPYGEETLVVSLEQQSSARDDVEDIILNALSYWEENSEQYAGYEISFEYQPNSPDSEAHIKIQFVENIESCGNHTGEVAGCAPLVTEQAPETAEIRIDSTYRSEWVTETLKHELGHTLGLGHDDEPAHIMSNEIEDRIPDYQERRDAIDHIETAQEEYETALTAWNTAIEEWDAGNPSETEIHAQEAQSGLFDARREIQNALTVTEQLDETEATTLLNETYDHIDYLYRATIEAITMAREEQSIGGDAESHRQAVNNYIENAEQNSFNGAQTIADSLGFR